MKHYGNISNIRGYDVPIVDLVTGGSPCQDLSVAGKRAGMKHEGSGHDETTRSGLFMEQIRIVKEMRENDRRTNERADKHIRPRYMVWENVPGAFSSNKGKDFQAVLEETAKIADEGAIIPEPPKGKWRNSGSVMGDGWSIAWRVFDAQFWGVPQRRRRIYLVADFGGHTAPEILFKRESLPRDIEKSREQGQGTSADTKGCTAEAVGVSGFKSEQSAKARSIGWQEECSPTLPAEGAVPTICFDPRSQDGAVDGVAFTQHINQPIVFEPGIASRDGGHCYEGVCGTLRANMGDNQFAVAIENHPADSRVNLDDSGTIQTLTSRMGTGGGNVPMTMVIRSGCEGGGKGPLIQEDLSATLATQNNQTLFEPKVYGICSKDSNSMKSDNPHSGCYEADTTRTLDQNGGNPACNQGGMMVVDCLPFNTTQITSPYNGNNPSYGDPCHTLAATDHAPAVCIQGSMIGRADKNGPQGDGINKGVSFTLNTIDRHAVSTYQNTTGPLMANTHPGSYSGQDAYTDMFVTHQSVRRLTPLECERLQGFPDYWTNISGIENPTEEQIAEWQKVFDDYNKAIGNDVKPKTANQVKKWLKNPVSDSAQYKALGNSVAIPNVTYVLYGIAEQLGFQGTTGSLFDGIGGFPLVWERLCGKESALWASEIEPFPILVTKNRFYGE